MVHDVATSLKTVTVCTVVTKSDLVPTVRTCNIFVVVGTVENVDDNYNNVVNLEVESNLPIVGISQISWGNVNEVFRTVFKEEPLLNVQV